MSVRTWRVPAALVLLLLPSLSPAQAPMDSARTVATAFLWQLQRGAFDSAATAVAPVAAAQISAERLRQIWSQLQAQVGALQALTPAGEQTLDTIRVIDLDARFERAPLRMRVSVTPAGRIAGFFIVPGTPAAPSPPPPYADTSVFREVPVTVGEGRWQLPGTLSLPTNAGAKVPAVVLVHGSGPNDRDGTAGAYKPLRDLAWGLASRGIAVLRYDKRTRTHGAAMATAPITLDAEVTDDALAAVALLRARPEIDSSRVFVLGHSLGGVLAPEIAARDRRLAGAILLAAPARSILEVLPEQLDYLASIAASPAERSQVLAIRETAAAIGTDAVAADSVILGAPASYWRALASVNPVARARSIDTPLLILQGGRDYQSTMEDFALWRERLAGRAGVTLESYPSLNHFFAAGTGKSTPAELMKGGHVAEEVVRDVASWILARGR